MKGNEIRELFLSFFEKHHHRAVRSSSLIPQDDPTLLFTNAGMVQFKRLFLGEEKRDYQRAVTAQKCVRAGGKHNDLENVGYTARHQTFFEMLGNFSFGDYFKNKAILLTFDLFTNVYKLPVEKLWVSVFKDDHEAYLIWKDEIGFPPEKIVKLGEKDNFWSMGESGPCGPCSEIYYDWGAEKGCRKETCSLDCDCGRFIELGNLVFMQYDRDPQGHLTPLPKPSIDTGTGLERLASVLQNVSNNYEIDLIFPIIRKIEAISSFTYGKKTDIDVAMKIIADHSRSTVFLIGDGVLPSNEGRGYVLRRIMRRAIRYGRNLGLTRPFMHETAKMVIELMTGAYPELSNASSFIYNVIANEEQRFLETLDKGLKLLEEVVAGLKEKNESIISGELIFKLYDTYGFPVDIIKDVVREEEIFLDMDGYHEKMESQRAKSRTIETFTTICDAYKTLTSKNRYCDFIGYEALECHSTVLLIVENGNELEWAETSQKVDIVTDRTPFYGESGGQVGDIGSIVSDDLLVRISQTVKDPTGLIVHKGEILKGQIRKGDTVTLRVDAEARKATARNHTATHMLHAVLRSEIGDHVKQAGSFVSQDRLRFDFSHFSNIDRKVLEKVEKIINHRIQDNSNVGIEIMCAEEAFHSGAMALFEEKYGDNVRVVSISDFSKEFCGGTHVFRTGEIGLFKIISESGIASGIRRIEAVTGHVALSLIQNQSTIIEDVCNLLRDTPQNIVEKISTLLMNQKKNEKEIYHLKLKLSEKDVGNVENEVVTINGIRVLVKKVSLDDPSGLRELGDKFKDRIQSGIIALGCVTGAKVLLLILVTKDLTARFHAGEMIKRTSSIIGGGGGGRSDMAQAGGVHPQHLDQAFEEVLSIVRSASQP